VRLRAAGWNPRPLGIGLSEDSSPAAVVEYPTEHGSADYVLFVDGEPLAIVEAKAFRGELVPTEAELARREGRAYEPASALLQRIREIRLPARSATPADARRRRRTHGVARPAGG
jgi:type I site-specific restriction endonuclease